MGASTPEQMAVKKGEKLPVIRFSLGDGFSDILKNSTYPFERTEFGKLDLLVSSRPVIFEYTRSGCGFTLPPALSFSAAIDNGHATNAAVSPHLSYLSQDQALELTESLTALFENAGWKIRKHYLAPAQLRRLFDDPQTSPDHTVRVRDWRCGDDELALQIERHWKKEGSLPKVAKDPRDLYVVSLKLDNDKVRALYPGW